MLEIGAYMHLPASLGARERAELVNLHLPSLVEYSFRRVRLSAETLNPTLEVSRLVAEPWDCGEVTKVLQLPIAPALKVFVSRVQQVSAIEGSYRRSSLSETS